MKNNENIKKVLEPVEKVAGDRIRKFPKDVQEDAWMIAYLAYCEGKDILKTLTLWKRAEQRYKRKILTFTRARPLRRDKAQLREIQKGYF